MKTTIKLNLLEGTWESVNLHPSMMIYRHYNGTYHLMLLPMNEYTRQAQPSTYEIEEDETGYFIGSSFDHQQLSYDLVLDTLSLSKLGDYMRN